MNENKRKMLLDWMRKIHQLEYAHCYQSIKLARIEKTLGISAFTISTIVAFSYRFPEVSSVWFNTNLFFLKKDYVVPLVMMIVALLTALQTFLKPIEKSESHKKIGFNYEKLRHSIEMILTSDETNEILDYRIGEIKKEWDNLDSSYVTNSNFKEGKDKVKTFKKYPNELPFLEDVNDDK